MHESSIPNNTDPTNRNRVAPPKIAPRSTQKLASRGILSGMRIRKKLIVLHTAFSISLGVVLLIAIRPAMSKVIHGAEYDEAEAIVELFFSSGSTDLEQQFLSPLKSDERIQIFYTQEALEQISDNVIYQARQSPGVNIPVPTNGFAGGLVRWIPQTDDFLLIRARSLRARDTIQLVYILVIVALIAGYALVAGALELFVLPEHVYRPISELLSADQAVREGDRDAEIIPDEAIPADELGSIMRSRNESILELRTHEKDLAGALDRLEHTAADLHKKNHLLENARKNLEGADRLASLGMMSAGIAHELNTPLAVVTGLVAKLNKDKSLSETEIALLARVVARLEKLSDGLLDFARVRPPQSIDSNLFGLVQEATTLVMIDRKAQLEQSGINITNHIDPDMIISCDPNRLVQVFVNLIRNATDALVSTDQHQGQVDLFAEQITRDSTPWIIIRIEDNGPGIDSALIDRLFEPFVSSRLDSHGTGLGLAVTNGIIREHGGILTATNRSNAPIQTGAVFEVMLPSQKMLSEDDPIDSPDKEVL
jgi:signal transduction histidine kinase